MTSLTYALNQNTTFSNEQRREPLCVTYKREDALHNLIPGVVQTK